MPKPIEAFQTPEDMVTDLLKQNSSGYLNKRYRSFVEYIAKENLSNRYPTSKDIKLHFKLGKSYTKHVIAELRKYAYLDSHSEKKQRLDQLILSNLLVETSKGSTKNIVSPEQLAFQLQIIKDFIEEGNYLLHNIRLDTELKDPKYYHDFQWPIRSLKNRAKVKEMNISPAVHVFISINHTGTVNIILACSRNPFDLTTPEGITNFQAACGEVHSIFEADLHINEPLINAPSDWELSHCDISVDIPIKLLQRNINRSVNDRWS